MKFTVTILVALLALVICSGRPVLGEAPGTWTLDDFEDGDLKATPGLYWIPLADELRGGSSEAKIEVRPGGPAASPHVLGLTGTLSGRASFAGAWVSLDGTGRSVDLRSFDGIRLRIKSTHPLQVGFRAGMINYMADVGAGAEWRLVDVPFASLTPLGKVPDGTRWNPDSVHVFGITTPQMPREKDGTDGEVHFEVDDVVFYGRGEGSPAPVASGPGAGIEIVPFTPQSSIPSAGWVQLADDPERDGKAPGLPDVTRLETIPSSTDGILWLRMTLREPPHDRWIGLNAVLDVDGDPANGQAWWGSNTAFMYDRLVTVWCVRVAEGCQGYVGIADADQVAAGTFVSGRPRGLKFAIDRPHQAFVVGVPREALRLGSPELRVVAAVGSALIYGDDVPGQGAATLR